jgi:hypothetical protein
MGDISQQREKMGSSVPVVIDPRQWEVMEDLITLRKNEIDKEDGLVDPEVLMDEMECSKKTLQNLVSTGKIKKDMYVVLPTGAELLKQRSYILRKKLEGGKESSSSSRKGRLSDQQREQLIANRRKRTMR